MTDHNSVPTMANGDWVDGAWLNQYVRDNFAAIFQGLASAGSLAYALDGNTIAELVKPAVDSYLKMGSAGSPSWEPVANLWPVGSVFIAVVSTNPATLLGFGTWTAFGAGRVMVGIDAGQAGFDTVEETGGENTHTLTTDEMPAHTHNQVNAATAGAADGIVARAYSGSGATSSTGGGGAHNNLQPYIVVYMWKRTA